MNKVLITQMLTVAETNFLFASPLWSVCALEPRETFHLIIQSFLQPAPFIVSST